MTPAKPKRIENEEALVEPTSLPTAAATPAPNEHDESVQQAAEERDEEITAIVELRDLSGELLPPAMGQRIIGSAVDWMFLETVTLFTVTAVLHAYKMDWSPPTPDAAWTPVQFGVTAGLLFTNLVFAYLYFGWWYTHRATTPGKWTVGLRVLDATTNGPVDTYRRAFLRETVGKIASVAPFMAGYVIAAFRKDRRALCDLMFNTKVVYSPPQ